MAAHASPEMHERIIWECEVPASGGGNESRGMPGPGVGIILHRAKDFGLVLWAAGSFLLPERFAEGK